MPKKYSALGSVNRDHEATRERIADDIKEYLARGGKIETVPPGKSTEVAFGRPKERIQALISARVEESMAIKHTEGKPNDK